MAYSDPNFVVTIQQSVVGEPAAGVTLSTVTASATITFTGTAGVAQGVGVYRFPVFKQPFKVTGIRVYNTGGAATITSSVMSFLNGTSVIGSCTAPGTATFSDATLTALSTDSHGIVTGAAMFTSTNGEILMNNVVVGTASAQTIGTYAVDLIWQNLFV